MLPHYYEPEMVAIEANVLRKEYGDFVAVGEGEISGFLGPLDSVSTTISPDRQILMVT
jgi:hypothetical protein